MAYEIWENTSANMAGSYATRKQALAIIAAFVEAHGPAAASTFSLVDTCRGRYRTIASGDSLVNMAAAQTPAACTTTLATSAVVTTSTPKASTTTH